MQTLTGRERIKNIIKLYNKLYGFNTQNVSALNSTFSKDFTPWKLGDVIIELFEERPMLKQGCIDTSNGDEESLPEKVGF